MDRDKMSNLYRGPSSFSSYSWGVSEEKIKMWKVDRRRMPSDGKSSHCFWQSELKKNCLWQPCLLMNRDEMSNLYRGPFKDAPYQVSIHLEKIKMWKVNGQRTPSDDKSTHCLWQGELKRLPPKVTTCGWWRILTPK
jgi:hypothetical protein